MGKRKVLFASAAVIAVGIGAGGIATAHGHDERFHVTLRADNETGVNDIPETDGRGSVKLTLDPERGRGRDGRSVLRRALRPFRHAGPRPHPHWGGDRQRRGSSCRCSSSSACRPDETATTRWRRAVSRTACRRRPSPAQPRWSRTPSGFYVNFHNARLPGGAIPRPAAADRLIGAAPRVGRRGRCDRHSDAGRSARSRKRSTSGGPARR